MCPCCIAGERQLRTGPLACRPGYFHQSVAPCSIARGTGHPSRYPTRCVLYSSALFPGAPARCGSWNGVGDAFDGRSADLRGLASLTLPGPQVARGPVVLSGWLTADSCVGSDGVGGLMAAPRRFPFSFRPWLCPPGPIKARHRCNDRSSNRICPSNWQTSKRAWRAAPPPKLVSRTLKKSAKLPGCRVVL